MNLKHTNISEMQTVHGHMC